MLELPPEIILIIFEFIPHYKPILKKVCTEFKRISAGINYGRFKEKYYFTCINDFTYNADVYDRICSFFKIDAEINPNRLIRQLSITDHYYFVLAATRAGAINVLKTFNPKIILCVPGQEMLIAAFISNNISMIKYIDDIHSNILNFNCIKLFLVERTYDIKWEIIDKAFAEEFKRYV